MRKITLLTFLFLAANTAQAYTLAPGEFPSAYADAVQGRIEGAVEQSQKNVQVNTILGSISLLDRLVSFSRVKILLAQLESLESSAKSDQSREVARLAALHKLMVPLVVQTTRLISAQLEVIDELLLFWKSSEEQYGSYFFHKESPHYIINKLEAMQEELHAQFGNLIMHVNTIPFGASTQEQYKWIQCMCSHLGNLNAPCKSAEDTQAVFESTTVLLAQTMSSIEAFPKTWKKRLASYTMPSFIRRHLVSLGVTTAGAAVAVPRAIERQDEICNAAVAAARSVQEVGRTQVELVRNALAEEREAKEELARQRGALARDIANHVNQENRRLSQNQDGVEEDDGDGSVRDSTLDEQRSTLNLRELLELAHVEFNELKTTFKAAGGDVTPLFEKLSKMAGAPSLFQAAREAVRGDTSGDDAHGAAAASPTAGQQNGRQNAKECVNAAGALLETGQLGYRIIRYRFEAANLNLRWAKAVLYGAVASIPVYATYKIAANIAERFKTKKSSDGLFEILRELKKFFLVNGDKKQSEMDPKDVGLMHHLLQKLERQTIPQKYREAFLRDIRLVQRPDLSADKRYELMNVLQDGYPFLKTTTSEA